MANKNTDAIGEKVVEIDSQTSEEIFNPDLTNISTISSPLSDHSNIINQPSKSPIYKSGQKSPVLEDGLPSQDNWPDSSRASPQNGYFDQSESNNSNFQHVHSRLSADWLQILQEGNRRYSFRNTNRSTFLGSGWQDLDKSGDYNDSDQESEKSPKSQRTKIRKRARIRDLNDEEYKSDTPKLQKPRSVSHEQARMNGRVPVLQSSISSENGINKCKALTIETPSHYSAIDETSNEENLPGHPEGRGCRRCYDLGTDCSLIDNYLSYSCDKCQEDDQDCILVTPCLEKRACEQCRHRGIHCSYINNDNEYDNTTACQTCYDTNRRCVAGPAQSYRIDDVLGSIGSKSTSPKIAAKTQCSFCNQCSKDKDGNSPKNQDKNKICRLCLIANSATTQESSSGYGLPGKKYNPPKRKAAAKTKAQSHPSTKRKPSSSKQGKWSSKQRNSHEKPRGRYRRTKFNYNLNPIEPELSDEYPGGKHIYITTSFCHPIIINHVPPPCLSPSHYSSSASPSSEFRPSSFPCHFCTDPGVGYAIGGLGVKRVEVIQWLYDPTLGYEELDGGWGAAKQPQTRICCKCTLERMMICFCTDHLIRPIKGVDPRTFDIDGAMQGLIDVILNRGQPGTNKLETGLTNVTNVKWCSICPTPAFFECCVRPAYTSSGIETTPSDDIGCGLLLCEVCANRMTGKSHRHGLSASTFTSPQSGDIAATRETEQPIKAIMTLDEHITAAAKDNFHYYYGLRADACFLKSDSELLRRQGAAGGDAVALPEIEELADSGDDLENDESRRRAFEKRSWGMGSPLDVF